MAVALDVASTAWTVGASPASPQTTTQFTVGAGANRALLVGVGFSCTVVPSVTVTWDSLGSAQAMTKMAGSGVDGANGQTMIFGLRNPVSGNKTLSMAWSGGTVNSFVAGIIAFTGVDQTTDGNAFKNAITNTSTSIGTPYTANVVEPTGDFGIAYFAGTSPAFGTAATGTIFGNSNTNVSGGGIYRASVSTPTTALSINVVASSTLNGSFTAIDVGAPVVGPLLAGSHDADNTLVGGDKIVEVAVY